MLGGYILYLICEYFNEKDNYNIAKINKECNKYIKKKYKNYRLKFNKHIEDRDLLLYDIYIENYYSKTFMIKNIGYYINLYNIDLYNKYDIIGCLIPHRLDKIPKSFIEENILLTIDKLKKKEYPIKYEYHSKYGYLDMYIYIFIDKYQSRICNSIVKTTDILLESILVFFKNIIQSKIDYILKYDEIKGTADQKNCIFYKLYKSEYATRKYKKEYEKKICEFQRDELNKDEAQ